MLPDRVSNPGPLTYESGALPIALRGPAMDVCPSKNNPENPDLSYKTDLDLWDCLRVKLVLKQNFIELI